LVAKNWTIRLSEGGPHDRLRCVITYFLATI
jgi:hypothetical protein